MDANLILLIVQVVAALGVVISVVYLGVQIHQQNEITKAQFGHSLTQRQYEEGILQRPKILNLLIFSLKIGMENLLTASSGELARRALVDIFDVYEKVQKGFVDEKHLTIRMVKLGTMKTIVMAESS